MKSCIFTLVRCWGEPERVITCTCCRYSAGT